MAIFSDIKAGGRQFLVKAALKVLAAPEVEKRVWEIVQRPRDISSRRPCNIEDAMYRNACRESAEYAAAHMSGVTSFPGRQDLFTLALSRVTVDGLFLEFGVAEGNSINFIADRVKGEVHGFDSFEGLPEDWIDGAGTGRFSREGALPPVRDNVVLHKGWFDQTIPEFARTHSQPIAFLHVDSDLYSSAKTIFALLGDRIVAGTVIQFDEYFNYPGWQQHEHKAFQEFAAERKLDYEYIGFDRLGYSVAALVK